MIRLSSLRNKISAQRASARKRARNKSEIDTIMLRAENEKLRKQAEAIQKENKLRAEKAKLQNSIKSGKKQRRAAKLAPIKTAFDRAKQISGNSPLAGKATNNAKNTNPLMGGNNDFLKQFDNSAKPKTATKVRKKRIKIIEYE